MRPALRIFILEDELGRYPRCQILEILARHNITYATSAYMGIEKYEPPYDLLLLDHDMEGFYEDPEAAHGNTGTNFVKWLIALDHKMPTQIILHSQHLAGRTAMKLLLKDVGYLSVDEIPFGPAYIKVLKEIA